MAADIFDFSGDGKRVTAAGTLKGHVLKQMSDAACLRVFMASAGTNPHAQRDTINTAHWIR